MYTKRDMLNDRRFIEASDDEPIFPLYGRDDRAPARVRDWATQRAADISLGRRPDTDHEQVNEAFDCANRMERWREENDGAWRTGLFGEPNAETQEAIREARDDGGETYETVKECLNSLRADDRTIEQDAADETNEFYSQRLG